MTSLFKHIGIEFSEKHNKDIVALLMCKEHEEVAAEIMSKCWDFIKRRRSLGNIRAFIKVADCLCPATRTRRDYLQLCVEELKLFLRPGSPERETTIRALTSEIENHGELGLAKKIHQEALDECLKESGGKHSKGSLMHMYHVSRIDSMIGNPRRALEKQKECLAIRESLSPPDWRLIWQSRGMIASILCRLGEYEEALELQKSRFQCGVKEYICDLPWTLAKMGDIQGAIEFAQCNCNFSTEDELDAFLSLLLSMSDKREDLEKALDFAESNLRRATTILPHAESHFKYLQILERLGDLHEKLGNEDRVAELKEQIKECHRNCLARLISTIEEGNVEVNTRLYAVRFSSHLTTFSGGTLL